VLREQGGSEFAKAADVFDALTKGRIHFFAANINVGGRSYQNVDGLPETYMLGWTQPHSSISPEGDTFIRGDLTREEMLPNGRR
jgi:hypothetical protein